MAKRSRSASKIPHPGSQVEKYVLVFDELNSQHLAECYKKGTYDYSAPTVGEVYARLKKRGWLPKKFRDAGSCQSDIRKALKDHYRTPKTR